MAWNKRQFIPGAVLVLLLAVGCGPAGEEPLSLVLVSLDTLRADRLGCYGYERDTSPKLDRFAGDAVLFEYAVSQANETVRSHRSFFTSSYPREAMARVDKVMLAERLQQAGFATGGFTDGGPMSKDFGFHRGFDEFTEWGNGIALKRSQALKWLDSLPAGQRFFCFIHCFDIHAPYAPPKEYRDLFGGDNPSRIEPKASADLLRRIREIIPAGGEGGTGEKPVLSDDDRRRMSDLYDGGIRYTDDELDHLFQALGERGLLERSVVVVLSDHGEEFWDHGSVLHGHTLHQELTRVPLVLRVPGAAPRRVAERVALLDLLPTLLDLLGLEPAAGAEGVSLVPLLQGAADARGGPPLLSEGMETGHYALIDGGYKLIRRPDRRQYELYHIDSDPLERRDIARQEPERVAQMSQVMRQHHQALADLPRPRPPKTARPGQTLDPRTEERLRQLGYLEPDEK